MLIRVPGIGIRGARKIISARRINSLTFIDLKKLGIVIKRAQYFVTCGGKYFGCVPLDYEKIKRALTPKIDLNLLEEDSEQISFFDNEINKILLPYGTTLTNGLSGSKKLLLLNDKTTSYTGEI